MNNLLSFSSALATRDTDARTFHRLIYRTGKRIRMEATPTDESEMSSEAAWKLHPMKFIATKPNSSAILKYRKYQNAFEVHNTGASSNALSPPLVHSTRLPNLYT